MGFPHMSAMLLEALITKKVCVRMLVGWQVRL
jgi:hypothetical protein